MKNVFTIFFASLPFLIAFGQEQQGKVIIKSYTNENGKYKTYTQEFDLRNGFSYNFDSLSNTIIFDSSFSLINDIDNFFGILNDAKSEIQKPYLGIVFQEVANKENENIENKIEVTNVMPNSSAEEAGILIGDQILFIDNEKVLNLPQIVQKVQEKKVGDILKIKLERQGKLVELNAKLKARTEINNDYLSFFPPTNSHNRGFYLEGEQPMPKFLIQRPNPRLGITVESMNSEMKRDLKIKNANGIIITKIIEGSNAQIAGLRLNDVILKIDDIPVTTPLEAKNQIESKKVGSNLKIQLKRYGKKKTIIAVLNEFSGKWDDTIKQTEFDPSFFPDINWLDENGNTIIIPLNIEDKIKILEELNQSKIPNHEKEKK